MQRGCSSSCQSELSPAQGISVSLTDTSAAVFKVHSLVLVPASTCFSPPHQHMQQQAQQQEQLLASNACTPVLAAISNASASPQHTVQQHSQFACGATASSSAIPASMTASQVQQQPQGGMQQPKAVARGKKPCQVSDPVQHQLSVLSALATSVHGQADAVIVILQSTVQQLQHLKGAGTTLVQLPAETGTAQGAVMCPAAVRKRAAKLPMPLGVAAMLPSAVQPSNTPQQCSGAEAGPSQLQNAQFTTASPAAPTSLQAAATADRPSVTTMAPLKAGPQLVMHAVTEGMPHTSAASSSATKLGQYQSQQQADAACAPQDSAAAVSSPEPLPAQAAEQLWDMPAPRFIQQDPPPLDPMLTRYASPEHATSAVDPTFSPFKVNSPFSIIGISALRQHDARRQHDVWEQLPPLAVAHNGTVSLPPAHHGKQRQQQQAQRGRQLQPGAPAGGPASERHAANLPSQRSLEAAMATISSGTTVAQVNAQQQLRQQQQGSFAVATWALMSRAATTATTAATAAAAATTTADDDFTLLPGLTFSHGFCRCDDDKRNMMLVALRDTLSSVAKDPAFAAAAVAMLQTGRSPGVSPKLADALSQLTDFDFAGLLQQLVGHPPQVVRQELCLATVNTSLNSDAAALLLAVLVAECAVNEDIRAAASSGLAGFLHQLAAPEVQQSYQLLTSEPTFGRAAFIRPGAAVSRDMAVMMLAGAGQEAQEQLSFKFGSGFIRKKTVEEWISDPTGLHGHMLDCLPAIHMLRDEAPFVTTDMLRVGNKRIRVSQPQHRQGLKRLRELAELYVMHPESFAGDMAGHQ